MTAALALLLIGALLIAIGRSNRLEPASPHILGAGFICILLAVLVFASRPAVAADPAPEQGERYIVLTLPAAQQLVAKLEAQAAEIKALRDKLKIGSVPKECI